MNTSSTRSRYAGRPSVAPKVSAARTAKPSMVERRKLGKSAGEHRSCASTRSRASRVGRSSTAARLGDWASSVCSASAGVRTLNNSVRVVTRGSDHVFDAAIRNTYQLGRGDREHGVGCPGGRPDLVVLEQVAIDERG